MSVEVNKQVVRDFFQALRDGDVASLDRLTTDDVVWWVAPTTIFSGTYQKAEWLALLTNLFAEAATPYDTHIVDLTAEEDRVSATATGAVVLKDGRQYRNDYHLLFFLRGGRIASCKEYMDSYRSGLVFGFPDAV